MTKRTLHANDHLKLKDIWASLRVRVLNVAREDLGRFATSLRNVGVIGKIVFLAAIIGALIGMLRAPADMILFEGIAGSVIGAVIAFGCSSIELQIFSNPKMRIARRLPTVVLMVARSTAYSIFIVLGLAVPGLFTELPLPWHDENFGEAFAISALTAFAFSTGIEVTRLLGKEATIALISGRYSRPRLEDRVVLFADIVGSTSLAEHIGELRFHNFMRDVFQELAEAIETSRGEVYRYVGDAVIVTWPLHAGTATGACLNCALEMHEALAHRASFYRHEFGREAKLRVSIHCGKVAAGEIGDWKKEIALLGDVMNTTARIENAARDYDVATILSNDVVQHLPKEIGKSLKKLPNYTASGKQIELILWELS